MTMLLKTYEIEMNELVEKARLFITSSKQFNLISFVPYVDEQFKEIRYLKFCMINESWEYIENTENFKNSFA